jgi:hypothetical protein
MATTATYGQGIQGGQFRSSIVLNQFLLLEDSLTQCEVENDDLTAPPVVTDADNGKVWILSGTGTGAWAGGVADDLAVYLYGGWTILTPQAGFTARLLEIGGSWRKYDGTSWTTAAI